MKTIKHIMYMGAAAAVALTTGCTRDFLNQDPLSFYEPGATYTNEAGLQAALAECDKQLRTTLNDGNGNVLCMSSNYYFTDVGQYAKTDAGGGFMDNMADKITPTSGMAGGGDSNAMSRFWDQGYNAVKYANTVLSYIDGVEGISDELRNAYKGRAYFHRAFAYYCLVLQFGDIPLVTKIISVPKQNYRSTSKEAIFQMLVKDLEFAVEHVPTIGQSLTGTVNKEACMHLLAKCYLVTGQYAEAEQMATRLINNQGLALMTANFGSFAGSGNDKTWHVERNVMWDLHYRPNITNAANKEMIMPILNFDDQNFTQFLTMRAWGVHWGNGVIKDPHGYSTPTRNYAKTNSNYDPKYDWLRAIGRGIGCFRTSYHYNTTIWKMKNGEMDWQDLRHNREVGNWVEMEDLRYNNRNSAFYGQPMQKYATEDYVVGGETLVKAGELLCGDTIRSWYPTPLYRQYILDVAAENNMGQNQFNGATSGSNGNSYMFRLAETYLVRAEARFYQGNVSGAADDVNTIRRRANAQEMFTTVTIGDIMDERARELMYEEWRQAELARVSWCLAKSGKADEWGNTYSINDWDKQNGTDKTGGNYWYQRVIRCNDAFAKGTVISNSTTFNFKVDKHNIFWPIPNSAITANNGARLQQNYGYDGYDASIEMWTNWQDAVADEDRVN